MTENNNKIIKHLLLNPNPNYPLTTTITISNIYGEESQVSVVIYITDIKPRPANKWYLSCNLCSRFDNPVRHCVYITIIFKRIKTGEVLYTSKDNILPWCGEVCHVINHSKNVCSDIIKRIINNTMWSTYHGEFDEMPDFMLSDDKLVRTVKYVDEIHKYLKLPPDMIYIIIGYCKLPTSM